MRNVILFILSILIFSCSSCKEKKKEETVPVSEQATRIEQPTKQVVALDTTSFEYFLQLSDNIIEEIPRYLIDKFLGKRWDNENDPYRVIYSEETDHYKLYENYIMTFSVSIYGVASETILASFSQAGQMIDHLSVDYSSDMDLSSTSYSYKGSRIFADSLIQILDKTRKAKNYDYSLPDSIDFYDLDSTEIIEILDYSYYVIERSGRFKEVFPLQPVLEEKELKKLNKSELRIKRNEFFARHGYTFKSSDLSEYFSKFDWYKPEYDDVNERLTAFDIYNITLIKQIEDKK